MELFTDMEVLADKIFKLSTYPVSTSGQARMCTTLYPAKTCGASSRGAILAKAEECGQLWHSRFLTRTGKHE